MDLLPNKPSKKLKTYVENVSELIIKGKLRHCQLAGIDLAEIIVPFTYDEINKLWEENEPWKSAWLIFGEKLTAAIPKVIKLIS